MLAAYHGHADLVRFLVQHGADPNRLNDRRQSPLAGAVFKKEDDVIEVSEESFFVFCCAFDPVPRLDISTSSLSSLEREKMLNIPVFTNTWLYLNSRLLTHAWTGSY